MRHPVIQIRTSQPLSSLLYHYYIQQCIQCRRRAPPWAAHLPIVDRIQQRRNRVAQAATNESSARPHRRSAIRHRRTHGPSSPRASAIHPRCARALPRNPAAQPAAAGAAAQRAPKPVPFQPGLGRSACRRRSPGVRFAGGELLLLLL